ncbi:hypothetical protein CMO96_03750 [Candidatus Woesebacteria bacterium]|nr:hypothetical protein [Candidatus Woesebacteria bacterium]
MKVIILIPTFNERENISRLLGLLQGVFKKVKKLQAEIIVVDDNSPDGAAFLNKDSTWSAF